MSGKFATKVVHYLLAISLLMLVLGSAWHVHDHHSHEVYSCLWCLAAFAVAVLVAAVVLTGTRQIVSRLFFLNSRQYFDYHPWSPNASRAPPVL